MFKRIGKTKMTLILISVISIIFNELLIRIGKAYPNFIESVYSRKIYRVVADLLNSASSVSDRSLGEIFIGIEMLIVLILIISCLYFLIRKEWLTAINPFLWVVSIISLNLIAFQLLWGLNNYRLPVEETFSIGYESITSQDLYDTYYYLVRKGNELRPNIAMEDINLDYILNKASLGYVELAKEYPFISNKQVKVKPLLISPLFSRSSYTGIYLPFFSEANINKMPPVVGLGFTAAHEIAHQKGFAGEDEANFLGILASLKHPDPFFQYSAILAMQSYVGNALYQVDADSYLKIAGMRSQQVLMDVKEKRDFWDSHVVESTKEVHNKLNDSFLKASNQEDGIVNYSKVTQLFVRAYEEGLIDAH